MFIITVVFTGCKKSEDGKVEVVPLAPTELKGTLVGKDQVDLAWKDNSTNETGYKIERKTDSEIFTEIGSTATDLTKFSDKTVSLNTNYTYRVYSFNTVGKSINYSNEVSIKTFNSPTLTTTAITEVNENGASTGGNVSSDGGFAVTARGVVWSTSSNPTIALNTKTSNGTGIGYFNSFIRDLAIGTKYFIRAYATNDAGTAYGNEITLTTPDVPVLTTNAISVISSSGVIAGGNISSEGGTAKTSSNGYGSAVTARGVVWGTNSNPTIALSTKTTNGSGPGEFQSLITGLSAGTKYYVRAYATNRIGTSYGNEISFTTLSINTVIGANGRIWMDRNLGASRVATNSTDEASFGDLYQWGRNSDGHQLRTSATTANLSNSDLVNNNLFIVSSSDPLDWRVPQNDNLWQGVNGINNPCPKGFRIPTYEEWEAERKSWSSNNISGAYSSSLKLPAAKNRYPTGGMLPFYAGGYWSSITQSSSTRSTSRVLSIGESSAGFSTGTRASGASCRCIKD
jgi:hypothetical protein